MFKRSHAARWIAGLFLLVFLCLIFLTVTIAILGTDQSQIIGSVAVGASPLQTQVHGLGQFYIGWENDKGGRLFITHQDRPDFDVWSSLPGQSFVSAGFGEEEIVERRGHFRIKDNLTNACARQTVEGIDANDGRVAITGNLRCEDGGLATYALVFTAPEPNQLRFELAIDGTVLNRSYLTYASQRDEHFYGFGEQFSTFDLKGKRLPILISEQGIGRGLQPLTLVADLQYGVGGAWHSSYAAVPHYITSKLRSMFLENSEYAVIDMRKPDRVQIQVFSPLMTGRILYGESPSALIAEYTSYAGRMRPLPEWVHEGAIISLQGGTDRVRLILSQLEEHNIPIAGIWLQDWVGQRTTSFGKQLWWNWELDEERYPRWDELQSELAARDIKLLTYVNPLISDATEKPNCKRHLFQEAAGLGFLVRNGAGEPYLIENSDFSAGLVDLSNPEAYDWMRDVIIDELMAAGVHGWMADFGEGLPFDAYLASGEPAAAYHNRYPEEWARLNREALETHAEADEMFFFMRSGYSQSPKHSTAFWLGDQLVSWDAHDGIKTAVVGLLSGGMSGYSLNHSDIGGYTSISHSLLGQHRSEELLKRWMELNAFTVLYRTHESNRPDENAQVYTSPEMLDHFDRFARVYRAWAFYRKDLVQEAAETGLPVVRHMFIHYPEDPNVYGLSYHQFMVGDEFVVAPVLDPGAEEVTVYLPVGRWVHLWTGDAYGSDQSGKTVTVAAPLGQPGVFYHEGSAVAEQFVSNLRAEGVMP